MTIETLDSWYRTVSSRTRGMADFARAARDMLWFTLRIAPVAVPSAFMLSVLEGVLPVASLWLVKRVVDMITALEARPADSWEFSLLVIAFLGIGTTTPVISTIRNNLQDDVAQRLDGESRAVLLAKANSFQGLRYFELPEFHDQLITAERGSGRRFYVVMEMLGAVTSSAAVVSTAIVLLASLEPLLGVVVIAGLLPHHLVVRWAFKERSQLFRVDAQDVRKQSYFVDVLTLPDAAREIKAYGLGDYFLAKYREVFGAIYGRYRRFRGKATLYGMASGALSGAISTGAFVWVVVEAYHGRLTVGDAVLYIGLLPQLTRTVGLLLGHFLNFHFTTLLTRHFFDFLRLEPVLTQAAPSGRQRIADAGLEFHGVTFRYPGSERPALNGVSFRIAPGERVALVGENGAGKTTLVKLLLRFYDPDEGEILLDDVPLPEYDVVDLRRRMAVVFQDPARFHLSVRENIALGNLLALDDDARLRGAAGKAQAEDLIEQLPSGYETLLGKHFTGGTELSGGQWQRIALARAFVRDADTIILDEPSAALDAKAEYHLFERFAELTAGRTALFITHRLGCVRSADRIIVCRDGEIVEEGGHDDLVAARGEYAEMFRMQSERYGESAG